MITLHEISVCCLHVYLHDFNSSSPSFVSTLFSSLPRIKCLYVRMFLYQFFLPVAPALIRLEQSKVFLPCLNILKLELAEATRCYFLQHRKRSMPSQRWTPSLDALLRGVSLSTFLPLKFSSFLFPLRKEQRPLGIFEIWKQLGNSVDVHLLKFLLFCILNHLFLVSKSFAIIFLSSAFISNIFVPRLITYSNHFGKKQSSLGTKTIIAGNADSLNWVVSRKVGYSLVVFSSSSAAFHTPL